MIDDHHLPPLLSILLPVLVSIFAGLYGRLIWMSQTLIPEKSELKVTFSGLTAAVVHLPPPNQVVLKRLLLPAARK